MDTVALQWVCEKCGHPYYGSPALDVSISGCIFNGCPTNLTPTSQAKDRG